MVGSDDQSWQSEGWRRTGPFFVGKLARFGQHSLGRVNLTPAEILIPRNAAPTLQRPPIVARLARHACTENRAEGTMTREELVAEIERDIKQKGGASVPIGVIRGAIFINLSSPPTIDDALRDFAAENGWQVRPDDDLPTLRLLFHRAENLREIPRRTD